MIFRKDKAHGGFSQIDNDLLYDERLKGDTYRLLCYLLSKPNDFKFFRKTVAKELRLSLATLDRYLAKLKKAGYLEIRPIGFDQYEWFVFEDGHPQIRGGASSGMSRRTLKSENLTNTDLTNTNSFSDNERAEPSKKKDTVERKRQKGKSRDANGGAGHYAQSRSQRGSSSVPSQLCLLIDHWNAEIQGTAYSDRVARPAYGADVFPAAIENLTVDELKRLISSVVKLSPAADHGVPLRKYGLKHVLTIAADRENAKSIRWMQSMVSERRNAVVSEARTPLAEMQEAIAEDALVLAAETDDVDILASL